jgi:hypothetical protein
LIGALGIYLHRLKRSADEVVRFSYALPQRENLPTLDEIRQHFPLPTKDRKNSEPQGHPNTVKDRLSPRVPWPADNAVGDVPEKPIEQYPEDKQSGEAAQLTFAYPI